MDIFDKQFDEIPETIPFEELSPVLDQLRDIKSGYDTFIFIAEELFTHIGNNRQINIQNVKNLRILTNLEGLIIPNEDYVRNDMDSIIKLNLVSIVNKQLKNLLEHESHYNIFTIFPPDEGHLALLCSWLNEFRVSYTDLFSRIDSSLCANRSL